jgi:Tol biopolymer transport system component
MTDLRERFDAADRIPVDDVWPSVRARLDEGPRPVVLDGTAPDVAAAGWRRALLIAAALILSVAAVLVVVRAFERVDSRVPAAGGAFAKVRGWITYTSDGNIYAIDPATIGSPSPDTVRLFDDSPGSAWALGWSRDGSQLLIARAKMGEASAPRTPSDIDLYLLDGGGNLTPVTSDGMTTSGSIAPDGSVVFEEDVSSADGAPSTRIVRVVPSTGERIVISTSADGVDWAPSVSPDGSSIALFHVASDSNGVGGAISLDLMGFDGSGRHSIVGQGALPAVTDVSGISWSPDGTRLTFGLYTQEHALEVYVANVDGSGLARIATDAAFPSWSPDGARISFSRADGSLLTMDARGGHMLDTGVRLVDPQGNGWNARAGAWNPVAATSRP